MTSSGITAADAMVDAVVVGAGPAALALGAACAQRGVVVCTLGPSAPWVSTYGVWLDDLDESVVAGDPTVVASSSSIDLVVGDGRDGPRRTRLARRYGVLDNAVLRARLGRAAHIDATVTGVRRRGDGHEVLTTDGSVQARLVIDATGAVPTFLAERNQRAGAARQTAYGLVLDHRPGELGGDEAVLMDWRPPSPDPRFASDPTFAYVVPLGAGRWLVEETSLARQVPMSVDELRARLAARLGADLTHRAEHVEHVSIPMAPGTPDLSQHIVGFGAAAGYQHPATGYSVAASLRAAPRVAAAIEASLRNAGPAATPEAEAVWAAVWPQQYRRARALHDYGLAALLGLPAHTMGEFFAAFFAMPTEQWAAYLRVDTTPGEVAAVMRGVFGAVDWQLRLRLMRGNPRLLARLLR